MASSSEGKTVSESFKQCGSCKASSSTKYCADCKIPLCNMCSNIHKNIPATQHHTVSGIQDSMQACKPKTIQGKCSTHNGQALMQLCTNCVQLLCSSCKIDHAGHDLQPLSDDPKVYNKICGKHIQQLIEDLHEIEELKSILEGHVTTYDEAIIVVDKWELDLIKMIKDKATKLRHRIKQLKDEKFKILGDKVKGLMGKLQEIDKSITKLNDIRKSMDTGILANELSKSQELIRKLELYKSELVPLQPAPDVDKMLPHEDKINDVDRDLNRIFSIDDARIRDGLMSTVPLGSIPQLLTRAHIARSLAAGNLLKDPQPVAEWVFTPWYGGKDLSQYGENPMTLTNIKYGRGPNGQPDTAVILPTSEDQSMIVMNPTDRLKFKNAMTFYCHIYIEETQSGYLFNYSTSINYPAQYGPRIFVNPGGDLRVFGFGSELCLKNVLKPKTWYTFAAVLGVSDVSVYVNGKQEGMKKGDMDLTKTNNRHIHIGRKYSDTGVQGRMACAKFYDMALTESEIQKLELKHVSSVIGNMCVCVL